MTFSRKNLNANETVALDLHPHWWYFSGPVAALVGSIIFGIWAIPKNFDNETLEKILSYIAIIAMVGTAAWTVGRYLKWTTTEFVITSHRLIFRTGVLAKHGIEIPMERVNNVNFHQTVFERMLGAGDLLIESGGEDGQSRFSDIKHPDKVQQMIHSQMELAAERRGSYSRNPGGQTAPAGPAGPVSVADELERLEGMLQRGTLTPEEFDSQKRRLLG
jgi:uncharacterized membrane protein YdbT with pleckstrin-like domain